MVASLLLTAQKKADIILQHRIRMAQVPQELPVPDYVVYEALHSVSSHNATVAGLSLNSTAVKTAGSPDYFWRKTEERRNGVQEPVQPQVLGGAQRPQRARLRGYALWLSRNEDRVDDTAAAYSRMEGNTQWLASR